jgi:hypothetical protein
MTKPMRDAIARSGYLMEQRLVPVVESFGFMATPNERFRDAETGELRELDIGAISGFRIRARGYQFVFPVLLIACKNLSCPIVFFTQQVERSDFFLGPVPVSGLPLQVRRRGKPNQDLVYFLRLEKFHHYYRTGRLASQFCAVYEAKKQDRQKGSPPVFEAGHTIGGRIELYRDFHSLAQAVVAYKRDHGRSFRLDRNDEEVNLQFYYPIFVTSGPLVECFVGRRTPRYRPVHRIGFLLRTRVGSEQREFRIDVVDEAGVKRLLRVINHEMSQVSDRIRQHRLVIKQSLNWITKKLARRKPKFRRSYVSGEAETD